MTSVIFLLIVVIERSLQKYHTYIYKYIYIYSFIQERLKKLLNI